MIGDPWQRHLITENPKNTETLFFKMLRGFVETVRHFERRVSAFSASSVVNVRDF
jgi:hypothetical protein